MKRINLLPKKKQQDLNYEKIFYSLSVAAIIAGAILVLGVVVQFGVKWSLDRELKYVDSEIENLKRTANKTENAAVKQRIKLVNAQIEDFTNLSKATPQWSRVMEAFVKDVPSGIRITQFTADSTTKEVTVAGFSPTRDLVIDLYNNINADKDHFRDINYPLENVAQPTNVQFNYTFYIVDSVLSEEKK